MSKRFLISEILYLGITVLFNYLSYPLGELFFSLLGQPQGSYNNPNQINYLVGSFICFISISIAISIFFVVDHIISRIKQRKPYNQNSFIKLSNIPYFIFLSVFFGLFYRVILQIIYTGESSGDPSSIFNPKYNLMVNIIFMVTSSIANALIKNENDPSPKSNPELTTFVVANFFVLVAGVLGVVVYTSLVK
ncbi:MAG: hypothetical protein WCO78_00035 [Candidatus Roizmanbacteria bacterium]